MEKHAGTQFDPDLAALMVELVRSGRLEVGRQEEQECLDVLSLRGNLVGAVASSEAGDYATRAGTPLGSAGSANGNGAGAGKPNGTTVLEEAAATAFDGAVNGHGHVNADGHRDGPSASASAAVGDADTRPG